MRKNQGITLIALIITIIILLILAGITIIFMFGENGLLTQTNNIKEETRGASVEEEVTLWKADMEMTKHAGGSAETYEQIRDRLYQEKLLSDKDIQELAKPENTNLEIRIGSKIISFKVKEIEENMPDVPAFTTVANVPDISNFNKDNTYYVVWDTSNSPYAIEEETKISEIAPNSWYDYTAGVNKWANVKTTGGGNDCYWVWIPRYAYKVPQKDIPDTIAVKFLKDNTNIPIGETQSITNTTPTQGEWVVHPAFTNNGNGGFGELTGIWVAKYEASSSKVNETNIKEDLKGAGGGDTTTLQVRVKPNVTSWRGITVGNIFTVCQNMITNGNSLEGTTKVDSHMMKNTEWGAVAYLSRSIYGKNSPVWNNAYYNDEINCSPITGLCGNTQDDTTTIYDNSNTYNEEKGKNASTSGNVYGVYDMAGGAWEYVAGILSSKKANDTYYDFSSISPRYYDSYDSYHNIKYGDAVYETSTITSVTTSWDEDYSAFVNSSSPVFVRGGRAAITTKAGVFSFGHNEGAAYIYVGFRPVVVSFQ